VEGLQCALQASSTMHWTAWHQECYQPHRCRHAEHCKSTSACKATSGAPNVPRVCVSASKPGATTQHILRRAIIRPELGCHRKRQAAGSLEASPARYAKQRKILATHRSCTYGPAPRPAATLAPPSRTPYCCTAVQAPLLLLCHSDPWPAAAAAARWRAPIARRRQWRLALPRSGPPICGIVAVR